MVLLANLSSANFNRKRIESSNDLAINGAPPAFYEPVHVGRPNIGAREAFLQLANEMFDRRWLSNNGPLVEAFEAELCTVLDVEHCVAMANATLGLELTARAMGLSGEVIVPSYTFIATAHALHQQGIKPVFADIDPRTHTLDPESVRRMITPQTSAILGVHLWGAAAPVEALDDIARAHGLKVFYDAAHAFASRHKGRAIGGFGEAEVFSFHATKVFNTFEGGAVATNNGELAKKLRLMRNFGFAGFDTVVMAGANAKMPEINAAMGLVNLKALPRFIEANHANFQAYKAAFAAMESVSIHEPPNGDATNRHYVVLELADPQAHRRDAIVEALHAENILARRYFWPGCHRMAPYCDLQPDAGLALPNTERVAKRVIVLPTGPDLPAGLIDAIAEVVRIVLHANACDGSPRPT